MTLDEFEVMVATAVARSPLCDVVVVQESAEQTLKLRVLLYIDAYIDIYFNERNGTTSYALVQGGQRVFAADNARGWHYHPFEEPGKHVWLDRAMTFVEFLAAIQRRFS